VDAVPAGGLQHGLEVRVPGEDDERVDPVVDDGFGGVDGEPDVDVAARDDDLEAVGFGGLDETGGGVFVEVDSCVREVAVVSTDGVDVVEVDVELVAERVRAVDEHANACAVGTAGSEESVEEAGHRP
jgi:hypothetical protein